VLFGRGLWLVTALDLQLRLLTTVALKHGLVKALNSTPECPL
jgi:hypothetical protein